VGFSKKNIIPLSESIQKRPVGVELFATEQTDGRTYKTKLIVASRNFANAPKNLAVG